MFRLISVFMYLGIVHCKQSDTDSSDAGSSHISSDFKHKANDGSGWFMIVQQQACLNGCCTAMWKETGEIITFPRQFLFENRENGLPKGHCRILDIERGSTRSFSVENWFWKRRWTCCKTDYGMTARLKWVHLSWGKTAGAWP